MKEQVSRKPLITTELKQGRKRDSPIDHHPLKVTSTGLPPIDGKVALNIKMSANDVLSFYLSIIYQQTVVFELFDICCDVEM